MFEKLTNLELIVLIAHIRSAMVTAFTLDVGYFDFNMGHDIIDLAEDVMNEVVRRDLRVYSIGAPMGISAWQQD